MNALKGSYYEFYSGLTLVAFTITSLIWLAAVWERVPAMGPVREVLAVDTFGASRLEVNARLRELNARLSEILR
jgi:hypothetical protein